MTELEGTTTEDLIRSYAPDLIPQAGESRLASHIVAFLAAFALAVTSLGAFGVVGSSAWVVLIGFIVTGALVAELETRRWYERDLANFTRDLEKSPWKFYQAVASKFEQEIERQRARTLGADSDWGRARKPLESAAQESARSVAYWEQRCAMDLGNEVARQQLETAKRLRDKFQEALTQLDARAHVLVAFFNECEARLAVINHAKRDYEEVRKLGALSERAEDIVANAEVTLMSIGSTFLSEAIRVGNALGGLERAGLLSMADSVPADRIETLADRILESSEKDRAMLERLTKEVQPSLLDQP